MMLWLTAKLFVCRMIGSLYTDMLFERMMIQQQEQQRTNNDNHSDNKNDNSTCDNFTSSVQHVSDELFTRLLIEDFFFHKSILLFQSVVTASNQVWLFCLLCWCGSSAHLAAHGALARTTTLRGSTAHDFDELQTDHATAYGCATRLGYDTLYRVSTSAYIFRGGRT